MALSVQKGYTAPVWPLGYVNVATPGNKVCIMTNVDANNVNNPNTVSNNTSQTEYSRACRGLKFQGYKPAANNNGMVVNSGNVYILVAPSGNNAGNRTDSGCMVGVLGAGNTYELPSIIPGVDMFSPYSIFIDSDNSNDGALVTLYGGGNP